MCEHIEFSQRLLWAKDYITSKGGRWVDYNDVRAYWARKTDIVEPDSYISSVFSAIVRSDDRIVVRGSKIRFETEAVRKERMRMEEEGVRQLERARVLAHEAAVAKAKANADRLEAEFNAAFQVWRSLVEAGSDIKLTGT